VDIGGGGDTSTAAGPSTSRKSGTITKIMMSKQPQHPRPARPGVPQSKCHVWEWRVFLHGSAAGAVGSFSPYSQPPPIPAAAVGSPSPYSQPLPIHVAPTRLGRHRLLCGKPPLECVCGSRIFT
jgi:hypothetical protein